MKTMLTPGLLDRMDAYWRAANYLSVGQIFLYDNPLLRRPLVLALPRGGVPIGAEIARALHAELDLIIVRKVGAPGNPELAVAAIVEGEPPDIVFNAETMDAYGLSEEQVRKLAEEERRELERRQSAYRSARKPASVAGRTVIVTDDGAATGTTMKAVLKALKRRSPTS